MLSGPWQRRRPKSHSHISCTVVSCHPCNGICKEQAHRPSDAEVCFRSGQKTKVDLGQNYLLKPSLGWAEVTMRIW